MHVLVQLQANRLSLGVFREKKAKKGKKNKRASMKHSLHFPLSSANEAGRVNESNQAREYSGTSPLPFGAQ